MPDSLAFQKIFEGVATRQKMFELFNQCPHCSDEDRFSGKIYVGRWFEITHGGYEAMFEILPPLFVRSGMFAMSEFKAGAVTSVFFEIAILGHKRWFHGYCDIADPGSPETMRAAILAREAAGLTGMTREEKLELIWENTHPRFRGVPGQANPHAWSAEHRGKRTMLVNGGGLGTVLKLLDQLTDLEIEEKLGLVQPQKHQDPSPSGN